MYGDVKTTRQSKRMPFKKIIMRLDEILVHYVLGTNTHRRLNMKKQYTVKNCMNKKKRVKPGFKLKRKIIIRNWNRRYLDLFGCGKPWSPEEQDMVKLLCVVHQQYDMGKEKCMEHGIGVYVMYGI